MTDAQKITKPRSAGEEELATHLTAHGIVFEREKRFAAPRRWRFDFFIESRMHGVAIEVDGGTWSKGRHSFGKGFEADCEKLNRAAIMGIVVLRYTPEMIRKGIAINEIIEAIGKKC